MAVEVLGRWQNSCTYHGLRYRNLFRSREKTKKEITFRLFMGKPKVSIYYHFNFIKKTLSEVSFPFKMKLNFICIIFNKIIILIFLNFSLYLLYLFLFCRYHNWWAYRYYVCELLALVNVIGE